MNLVEMTLTYLEVEKEMAACCLLGRDSSTLAMVACKVDNICHKFPKVTIRGGINKKNWYFLTFGQKGGGGVSAKAKKSYQKILRFF